jgi:type I restriction enzyme, S subunit
MSNSDKLKNLTGKIGSGATPTGGQNSYKEKGIALIRSQNVQDLYFTKDGLAFIDEKQAKKLNNVEVNKNDILLNITGDSIARVCMVPDEMLPARVNQHVAIIRANEKIDSRYLLYYLIFRKKYLLLISRVGGTRNALTKPAIENINIRLSKNDKKIASVLSSLDSKIELNNRINGELEALAKTIYDYWFVQFDFPDKNGKPYKSSGGKMVWNEELKREIPEGWEVKTIGEYAQVKKGELITAKDAVDGDIKVVAAGINYSYKHNNFNRLENTITISGSGANAGFINFWREPIFASDCITVRGRTDTDTILLLHYLSFVQSHILNQATGSAQPHVYPSDIKNLNYTVLNDLLMKEFGKLVIPMNTKIAINIKQNQQLSNLRDWLLPMLMNGQVTVGKAYEQVEEVLSMVAEDEVVYNKKKKR